MKYKVGDILRNPHCPGDGNPSRVCVYLGQESYWGNKHVVMYQDGSMGLYSPKEFGKHPPYELIGNATICIDNLLAVVQTLCEETDRKTEEEYQKRQGATNAMTPKNNCANCKWFKPEVVSNDSYFLCEKQNRHFLFDVKMWCKYWEVKDGSDD